MSDNTANQTAKIFEENAQQFDTKDEYLEHLQTMIVLSVAVMQSENGRKFTKGFMYSALKNQVFDIDAGKSNPKFNTH